MANTPSAKKAVRKIERKTEVNKARRSRMRTFIRKVEEAISSGDGAVAKEALKLLSLKLCALHKKALFIRIWPHAKSRVCLPALKPFLPKA